MSTIRDLKAMKKHGSLMSKIKIQAFMPSEWRLLIMAGITILKHLMLK